MFNIEHVFQYHRIVRTRMQLNLKKERRKMINFSEKEPWHPPTDTHGFQRCISNLEQPDIETNIENLNDAIVRQSEKILPENTKGRKKSLKQLN